MIIEVAVVSGGSVVWHKLKQKKSSNTALALQVIDKNRLTNLGGQGSRDKVVPTPSFSFKRLVTDLKSVLVGNERNDLQKDLDSEIELPIEVSNLQVRSGRSRLLSAGALGLVWGCFIQVQLPALLIR